MKKIADEVSKSVKMRKYKKAYEACMEKMQDTKISPDKTLHKSKSKSDISHKKFRTSIKNKTRNLDIETTPKRKPLNEYQKFVKKKSSEYKNISPKSRLKLIAKEWRQK